ncbi:MAG: hypothetical protein D3920_14275 [Candidatus Electrothrix sp. AW2]|nr:hypothetical protein [Candidatus Electrothrix gigas]
MNIKEKINRYRLGIRKKSIGKFKRNNLPKILVNSIPKSGTNLLMSIVHLVPDIKQKSPFIYGSSIHDDRDRFAYIELLGLEPQNGDVVGGHIPYGKEIDEWIKKNKLKHIFIFREPRDVTVSLYHYIMKDISRKHPYYDLYASFKTDHERLMKPITGYGDGCHEYRISRNDIPSIAMVYEAYKGWLETDGILLVRYEELISNRREQVERILRFLDINLRSKEVDYIVNEGFNPKRAHTFRKGISGGWLDEYTPEHIQAFKDVFSLELLNEWGYNWD